MARLCSTIKRSEEYDLHRFLGRIPSLANRTIRSLLATGRSQPSALARLLGHASRQDAWTAQLRALLPQELASECRVGNVRDQILTVHINSAGWATRFRFLTPSLLGALRQLSDFAAITEIRVKVVAVTTEATPAIQGDVELKPAARPPLVELASRVDSEELRNAILRLAAHAQPTSRAEPRNVTSPPAETTTLSTPRSGGGTKSSSS